MQQKPNNRKSSRARASYALFSTFIVHTVYWFLWFLLCALLKDEELGKTVSTILMLALFAVLAGGYFYFLWRYEGKSRIVFSIHYFFWVIGKMLLDDLQLVVLFLFYVCSVLILIGVSVVAALAVFAKKNAAEGNWDKASAGFVAVFLLLALALWLIK